MKTLRIIIPVIVVSLVFVGLGTNPTRCMDQILPIEESVMDEARGALVEELIAQGIRDERVIEAMRNVRRHKFLPRGYMSRAAYGNHPLPIGHNQTISQPFIVAYMTEKIAPDPGEKVLEIGTGSGYQAAVLAEMGAEVYSIEIIPELAEHAREALKNENYEVHVKTGDGFKGWQEHAPYSVIIVTCAPEDLPEELVEQLADNGRMILPLGPSHNQRLVILRKTDGEIVKEDDLPVRFVPMVKSEEE